MWMQRTMDTSKKTSCDPNEKLYFDCYFHLLQCKKDKNFNGAMILLHELIVLSDFHCQSQKLSQVDINLLKNELFTEYFNFRDQAEYADMLSIHSDNLPKHRPIAIVRSDVNIFQEHLNRLISNTFSASKKDSPSLEFQHEFSNKLKREKDSPLQSKFSGSEKFNLKKRPVSDISEPGSSSKRAPSKMTYGNRSYIKANSIKNETNSNESSFKSAKSMYRNPLKNVHVDVEKEEEASKLSDENSDLRNHETLKHFDKKIVDVILHEIMDFSPNIKWNDIAGLEFVKTTVQEIVIWPLLRPDIFTGLRAPPRGILLFGPPGTGKTLIGKCIATESNSTFFCISASSLASKWVGESEQLVRALFAAARLRQPAVIFIDEIDSLLSQRSEKDQDFTRKLKTEFLVQFDGAKTNVEERVLVVGATNRPHELDEAARRRFVKRLYVPLPEESARRQIVEKLLCANRHELSEEDMQSICNETKGYSGSDVAHLCKEAAMGPIRCIGPESIKTVSLDQVRPINLTDFVCALRQVRASVAQDDLDYYWDWNKKFGSFDFK